MRQYEHSSKNNYLECKTIRKNQSKFINATAAASFSLLCLGEAAAIKLNKKIPEDQKKFMIPQALSEGALNVGIMLSVSTLFRQIGSRLVTNAKVLPKDLPKDIKNPEILKKIIKTFDYNDLKHLSNKGLTQDVFKRVKSFHNGMTTLTGPFAGLLIAQNVMIPIVINKFAAWYRENYYKKHNFTDKTSMDLAVKKSNKFPAFKATTTFAKFTQNSAYYKNNYPQLSALNNIKLGK